MKELPLAERLALRLIAAEDQLAAERHDHEITKVALRLYKAEFGPQMKALLESPTK